jgi:hypothetical protein
MAAPRQFRDVRALVQQHQPSTKCSVSGMKIIPFLLKVIDKDVLCDIETGVFGARALNSNIMLSYKGNVKTPPTFAVPPYLAEHVEDCEAPFVVLAVGLTDILGESGHSNLIILDLENMTAERFEPSGYTMSIIDPKAHIDEDLNNVIQRYLPDYEYISAFDYCPYHGFPGGLPAECPQNTSGYCVVVSTLYAHLRLLNPDYTRDEVTDKLLKLLRRDPLLTRRYASLIDATISDDIAEGKYPNIDILEAQRKYSGKTVRPVRQSAQ